MDDTPAETLEGGSQILIAADGSLTVVWSENGPDHQAVIAVDKAPGTSRWSAPRRLSAPSSWAGDARVGTGSDGRAVLVWTASEAGGGPTVMEAVVRPAGSTQWGPIEAVGPVDSPVTTQPLVAPNGEITLVWVGFMPSGGYATLTSTRSAAGAWSAVRTLSTEYVPEQFDAEIGPDGTVHAGWVQNAAPGSDSGRIFRHAARVNGVWTAPTTLSRKPSSVAIGQVAGGPQGRTTAVWHESTGDFIGQLWTAGTGLTKPEPPVVPAVRRDYVGAGGFVDLFARTSSGALTVYQGNASRVFSAKAPGGTWPTTSTLIPFGDLNADGVNDVLVRDSGGGLRAYYPEKGKAVTPTSRSAVVGSGWTGFNAFVVSGDFTGDGRTDLVARQTSTGDLYLYAGNSKGGLTRTGRIGTKWKPMTIVGAGDLNGDKRADLLARDAAGVLWRYYGNGKGGIGAGAKAGSGWNGFTAIVGVGDLTKDGKDDLVGRDAAGTLWRYDGTGAGRFSAAVKIGIGWNGFATLS
ncbi:FG-GAP repeat domain-containing protein [Streptomyces sp. NPDC004726]